MALPKAEAEALTRRLAARTSEAPQPIPLLENGDRLTRDEFERRYQAMPAHSKAELIEGIVYMSSPVRHKSHGKPHRQIITWLGVYCAETPGVDCSDNATLRIDADNEPQPDVQLFIEEESGGKVHLADDDFLEGASELTVEVAASSASYDLHAKLHIYRRNGVQEYLVWRQSEQALDWFRLEGGQYLKLSPDAKGIVRSRVFPGLWLDVSALLAGNMKKVLAVLRNGLATSEHAAFVKKLAAARRAQQRQRRKVVSSKKSR